MLQKHSSLLVIIFYIFIAKELSLQGLLHKNALAYFIE